MSMQDEACPTCGALLNQANECGYQHGGVILDDDSEIITPSKPTAGVLADLDDVEILVSSE
jgi:hypothetical protein